MKRTGARVNWKLVLSNIAEAREELQNLERALKDRTGRSEAEIEVGLGHAYHHLNFAWRARHLSMARYRAITNAALRRLSQFPRDVWFPGR